MGGVAWGVLSAVALGANGILVALATRRVGLLATTAVSIAIAFVLLLGYAFAVGAEWSFDRSQVALLAFLAAAAAVAILASYRGLELGPLAVVSPVSAANGAFTVLFAFAFIHERPTLVQWVGVGVTTAGAVVASVRITPGARVALIGPGPLFAAVGVVAGAISNAGLRVPIREIGSIQAIAGQRALTIVYVWLFLLLLASRGEGRLASLSRLTRRGALLLLVVGILDAVSFLTYAEGLAVAPAWLIGTISQSGRVISVVGGIVLFRERLRDYQWAGIALLAVGLTMSVVG